MTEGEAIAEAERAAREAGYRVDEYDCLDVTSDRFGWRVFYQLRPPTPVGGHFSVLVDGSGGASIIPGR